MQDTLLPDRHPNGDFFIADIFDAIPVKSDRHTMEYPFFTLSTRPDFRVLEYKRDGISITIIPQAKLGLPTMMDKDVLLYVGSLMMREINAGRIPPKTVRFSCHDLLVTTNRDTGGHAYEQLKNAFERITGALITTNIKTHEVRESAGFHILDKFRIIETSHDKRRMVRVQVTVSDWLYNALVGREVLTLNREYFRLRKPLERRLYELARKHCGQQAAWVIGLANLSEKCGARSPLKNFRFQLRAIIHPPQTRRPQADAAPSPHFPDYHITLDACDRVTFTNRYHLVAAALQGAAASHDAPDTPSVRQTLTRATLSRGARLVEEARTGWDYGALLDQFSHAVEQGFEARNLNAAFLGFVRKKVAQRP